MNLEEFTKKEALLNKSEIFDFNFEGKKYWLKRARATKPNKIQKFFYKIFSFELLIPSLEKSPEDALTFETAKIEKLKKIGINVPNIVYMNEDFFVLEDCGDSVNSYLRTKNITQDKFYYFIEKLLIELSKIHNCGQFHGGTQLRNFTYKDEKVFVIDFEESFDSNISLETLQFRDFLLFILSFIKIKEINFEIDYNYIINKYIEYSKKQDTMKNYKILVKKYLFYCF
ncbi:RIO1 family regulatory kinase/ATPase domain-containing protein [Aliarcobacter butzleri]|uniref:RIO1 family regulatory kinase/ATPase domain-containing protein n=1 Tax=Aliarcobacter butzleri TaxID=28197 RepID=UPI002094A725|nr:RIO1 family regulatory kinase/ATPase [Aliarcobacter butzleri]